MHFARYALGLSALTLMAQRPLQVDDLFKVKRVGEPQVSAKGDIAYQVAQPDPIANKTTTHIWLKKAGEAARELDLGSGNQSRPRFSPDGSKLAYQAGGQIWVLDLGTQQKTQVTKVSGGASTQAWSPDGTRLAFLSMTVPSGVETENAAYLKEVEATKSTGRHIKTLMFRHMEHYRDPKQVSHLFVVKVDGSEAPRDLTAGLKQDVPDFAGTAANDGFAWSPDSRTLAFGSHPEAEKATSTNGEIYEVSADGGPWKKVSQNPAMDSTPAYSPDGKYLAWRAQRRPGFESDKWEIWVQERASGKVIATTQAFDRQAGFFAWNGPAIVFEAGDKAQQPLFRWEPGKAPVRIGDRIFVDTFTLYPDGKKALAQITSSSTPVDLYDVDLGSGAVARITTHNQALAEELKLNRGEDLWVKGAPGKDGKAPMVHALVVKPVGFDPSKKYPVAFVIHGGPQGANADQWHTRWNLQSWAGRGFIVVAPNPRGSTGFGQQYTDEISGDWSGRVMTDMMNLLTEVHKKYPTDPKKVVACGGSYGGYAVNWLAGHQADRFAAFVSHAGIYNTLAMQTATEELWFPRWEFKGFPWESKATRDLWEKHSPHNAAASFKKPMLVIHGELDYRVVYTEALQLFNTHQLRGIPSELLLFPDETHFILKPANSRQWYTAVMDWCERWVK